MNAALVDQSRGYVSVVKARHTQLWRDGYLNFGVQEKFKLEVLRFWNRYGLLTGIKVVSHQKSVYSSMRATILGSGISILIFVPLCDELKNQCHLLNILKV